ncbi:MAG: hypothetical protein Kow0042_31880 [Calditrichia bacterium]
MIRWRIIVEFQPGNMGDGITALKKIVNHLEQNLGWPKVKIYRGYIGREENCCEIETDFPSLSDFEAAWQKWGKSPDSKMLAEKYHRLVNSERIEILQLVE